MVVEAHHPAAGAEEHRLAGGGVPFHGAAEPGVEVGLAGGDEAELERGAGGAEVGDGVAGDVVVGRLVAVRLGGDDDEGGRVGRADAERGERAGGRAEGAGLLLRAAGGVGVEEAVLGRGVDDAAGGDAVLDQRDVDGEVAAALDELLGAVERVDEEEDRRADAVAVCCSSVTTGISGKAASGRAR